MDTDLRRHIEETRVAQAKRHTETKFSDLNVNLGPLTSAIRMDAKWRLHEHLYPAWQVYADELERIFEFAESKGELERYRPRLIARIPQRDSALDELRVAYHFEANQFTIVEWEPDGHEQRKGEFLICGPSGVDVFVEVKGPRWEGELKEDEIRAGRTKEPKDLYLEARAIAPWMQIQNEIDKAYGKFSPGMANLLVIVGHRGFVSMEHGTELHAGTALYQRGAGYFTSGRYCNLGGVAIFWMANDDKKSWYEMKLFRNSYCLNPLPNDLLETFPSGE